MKLLRLLNSVTHPRSWVFGAVSVQIESVHGAIGDFASDCTNFPSKGLRDGGGFEEDSEWSEPMVDPWRWGRTPGFFDYWAGKDYTAVISLDVGLNGTKIMDDEAFKASVLQGLDFLREGDMVFFDDGRYSSDWEHMATIISFEENADGILFPIIADHSGPYSDSSDTDNYDPTKNRRFIYDTYNTNIIRVFIILLGP